MYSFGCYNIIGDSMKNIVIKKTSDFNSKGELLVRKNGRIVVEAVDPKSLSQIIEYVRNNFYSLDGATIDEENFSFKYGKYKVEFEFYKSYDFIRDNIRSLKNNKPKKIIFINRRDLIIDFGKFNLKLKEYDFYSEINNIISQVRAERQNVIYHIKGDNLYTKVNDIVIVLNDYKKFSSNRNFRYIFEDIKKKKFKAVKNTVLAGTLSIIAAVGVTSLITEVKAANQIVKEKPDTEIETSIPLTTEEEILILEETYVDSEPESLVNVDETKITTEVDTKPDSLTEKEIKYENNKYEELEIGSLANDEKLLTTKRLYFDIIEKYATKYGLDSELVLAIATQERGVHSNMIDEGGAIGLMQVQVDVWLDKSLTIFDYDQNKEVTINFTMDMLKSLEGNIEAGCAITQHYQSIMKGNTFATIQCYNSGPYAVEDMIEKYMISSGKTTEEIYLDNDLGWYDYCTSAYNGDPDYLEHVLRYYQGDIKNLEQNSSKTMS